MEIDPNEFERDIKDAAAWFLDSFETSYKRAFDPDRDQRSLEEALRADSVLNRWGVDLPRWRKAVDAERKERASK